MDDTTHNMPLSCMPLAVLDSSDGGMDDVVLLELHSSTSENGAVVFFNFNGLNVAVSIFQPDKKNLPYSVSQFGRPIQSRLIELVSLACTYELLEDFEDGREMMTTIMNAGRMAFRDSAEEALPWNVLTTVHNLVFPPYASYQLLGDEENNAIVVPATAEAIYAPLKTPSEHYWPNISIETEPDLRRYAPSDLIVNEEKLATPVPGCIEALVYTVNDSRTMYCKILRHSADDCGVVPLKRDIVCLNAVHRLLTDNPQAAIQVPRLLGYVKDPNTGRLLGYLREHISGQDLHHTAFLFGGTPQLHPRWQTDLPDRLRKWMRQIHETVAKLHSLGVAWGTCCPMDILIDRAGDDAWLVKFYDTTAEGDYTPEQDKTRLKMLEGWFFGESPEDTDSE